MRPVKIESQVYRLGEFVVFKTARAEWKMGEPVDWDDPLCAGLVKGTVSYHRTLRDCGNWLHRAARRARWKVASHG